MYRAGQKEIDRIAAVINSGKLFRYRLGGECARFEQRYAEMLGVKHCVLTSSGTNSLTAALVGLGVGPGDEVLVPACTYMATAVAVLAVGAIPVVVDIDESITLDPKAVDRMIGERTRAVIPVHMWGLPCDMDAIMRVAKKRKVFVVEDACQAVGGGYKDRMLGSIGHMGAFSFNYYKNMTCGEGGAVVTNNDERARRMRCAVDCCNFYWDDKSREYDGFTFSGSRASELEGAILNAQLDRIVGMVRAMRRQKARILKETAAAGLRPAKANSPDSECGTHAMFLFDDPRKAARFSELTGGTVLLKTGRHVYTEWDPILRHRGGPHPGMNPFLMEANRECRMDYSRDMCARSLDILGRTVSIATHPDRKAAETAALIKSLKAAAREVAA